jgi:L-asparaginase II
MQAVTPVARAAAHVPLAVVTRGESVESVHAGAIAVADADGRVLYAAGDPALLTFTRSALKPLQALPFVAAGGPERFGFDLREVAMLCASHAGEARHVEAAASMLRKAGNRPDELQCGTHAPGCFAARGEVPPPPPYSPLAHNCSGKHSGMLAHCVACGWRKDDYLAPEHPLQRAIRAAVAEFTAVPAGMLVAGIDGCSAPNYAVPLFRLAQAFARLASTSLHPTYGRAPRLLADAMLAHPEMVSGERGSDLALTTAGRGDWICKIGAEGVQAIGIRSRGWGLAVKVADGNVRGLLPATVAALDQLGLLDDAARAALAHWGRPAVRNYRGVVTGEVQGVVVLDKSAALERLVDNPAAE